MEANICKRAARIGARIGIGSLLALALAIYIPETRGSIISIDDFAQPATAQFFAVPPGTNSSLEMSQVVNGPIGGQRDMLFHVAGQAAINSATGLVGHDSSFSTNALQLATNGTAPTVLTLQYSGLNALNTPASLVNAHALGGASGIDFTSGGTNTRFQFQFMSSDAQPTTGLDVAITVTSPGGSSTASSVVANSITPFTLQIPFTQLVGNAALNHVDSITVAFNGARLTPNIDFEIQGISAVPEPATCLTMAIGGVLFGAISLTRRFCR